jgi:hypothetical protein
MQLKQAEQLGLVAFRGAQAFALHPSHEVPVFEVVAAARYGGPVGVVFERATDEVESSLLHSQDICRAGE